MFKFQTRDDTMGKTKHSR